MVFDRSPLIGGVGGDREPEREAGFVRLVRVFGVVFPEGGHDEPESLILAQSERWRHA